METSMSHDSVVNIVRDICGLKHFKTGKPLRIHPKLLSQLYKINPKVFVMLRKKATY